MNKNEILKKAQKEKNDELEIQIRGQSMKWSYIAMVLVAFIFSVARSYQGLPIMDLPVTVCSSIFVGNIYRFIKTKNKGSFFVAIITFMVVIISLIRYFMGH